MTLFEEIEHSLDALAKAGNKSDWSDAEWTRQLKSRLAKLGKENRYWVYASSVDEADGGEWLYDLTWLNYSGDYLLNVELVLESEWNFNGVDEDFEKLLVARAELRVLVFQAKTRNKAEEKISGLTEQVCRFKKTLNKDKYLFSCWLEETGRFLHRRFVYDNDDTKA